MWLNESFLSGKRNVGILALSPLSALLALPALLALIALLALFALLALLAVFAVLALPALPALPALLAMLTLPYAEISCHDLRIENQMMHCIIDVEETLWLGSDEKANGKLIAGYIQAGKSVHAGMVGATAGSTTIINFSKKIIGMIEHIEDIDARLKIDSDKTTELQLAVNKLKKLPKDKVNPEMLNKLVSTYKFHANKMGEILNEKEAFEEEIQAYMTGVFVEATEKLYHGVTLIVGDFNDNTRREYGPTKMSYRERKIHLDPIVHTP